MKKGMAIFPGWLFPFVYCVAGVDAYDAYVSNPEKGRTILIVSKRGIAKAQAVKHCTQIIDRKNWAFTNAIAENFLRDQPVYYDFFLNSSCVLKGERVQYR